MLGAMLSKAYRGIIGRILGVDAMLKEGLAERAPALVQTGLRDAVYALLRDSSVNAPMDVVRTAYFISSFTSAQYFLEHMRMAQNLVRPHDLIRFAMKRCTVDGLILEFGVFKGASLSVIAQETLQPVYGFDSFEGLPEDWTHLQRKGRFSLEGRMPEMQEENVRLIRGWFDRTLPEFLVEHPEPVRFLHVDSDLYSSAVTILTQLRSRIVPGTVIVFDEYLNYPGWEHHEFRAFREFINETRLGYAYLGLASSAHAVAVQIG